MVKGVVGEENRSNRLRIVSANLKFQQRHSLTQCSALDRAFVFDLIPTPQNNYGEPASSITDSHNKKASNSKSLSAGMKKGRIYGLGMESIVLIGRPYCRGSCSSSADSIRRHELEELRKEMEEVRSERDELQNRIAKTESALEGNNNWMQALINSMNCQSRPYSISETEDEDEDETQTPSAEE